MLAGVAAKQILSVVEQEMPLSLAGELGLRTLVDQFDKIRIIGRLPASTGEAGARMSMNSSRMMYKRRVRKTRGFDVDVEAPCWLLASRNLGKDWVRGNCVIDRFHHRDR